jgi:hypothetical protein
MRSVGRRSFQRGEHAETSGAWTCSSTECSDVPTVIPRGSLDTIPTSLPRNPNSWCSGPAAAGTAAGTGKRWPGSRSTSTRWPGRSGRWPRRVLKRSSEVLIFPGRGSASAVPRSAGLGGESRGNRLARLTGPGSAGAIRGATRVRGPGAGGEGRPPGVTEPPGGARRGVPGVSRSPNVGSWPATEGWWPKPSLARTGHLPPPATPPPPYQSVSAPIRLVRSPAFSLDESPHGDS